MNREHIATYFFLVSWINTKKFSRYEPINLPIFIVYF